jgi:Fur family zinc uptake transcriptional regulator
MATVAHQHPAPGSDALRNAARARLEAEGIAWTDLRAAIYESLVEAARPASAYDVSEVVSRRLARRVAANSVYRILDLFVVHNLARRVESRNAYVANVHPGCLHDCIFLVCEACGGIDHVDDDQLAGAIRQLAEGHGFVAKRTALELLGLCRACRA